MTDDSHPLLTISEYIKLSQSPNFDQILQTEYYSLDEFDVPIDQLTQIQAQRQRKNRYSNVIPNEEHRVRLQSNSDISDDYINASHVRSTLTDYHYIAASAPIPSTFLEWWTMVWQQDVRIILMLTREKERTRDGTFMLKADRYWDDTLLNVAVQVGSLLIKLCKIESIPSDMDSASLILRQFELSSSADETVRNVFLIHYIGWPDFGVPSEFSAFELFMDTYRSIRTQAQTTVNPILVHCSAGIGRTGTFCAIDSILNHAKDCAQNGKPLRFSLFQVVKSLRVYRPKMVQSKEQYEFAGKYIAYALSHQQSSTITN